MGTYSSYVTNAVRQATAKSSSGGSSSNLVNPGSVWQSYDPKTGKTTYGGSPTISYSGKGAPVATPNAPANAMVAGADGSFATYGSGINNVSQQQQSDYMNKTSTALGALPVGQTLKQNVQFEGGALGTIVNKEATLNSTPVVEETADNLSGAFERAGVEYNPQVAGSEQQQVANPIAKVKPGQRIPNVETLNAMTANGLGKESIRRGNNNEIYYAKHQVEVDAIGNWIKMFGKPQTPTDWKKFHDFAYEGRLPNQEELPGANDENPDSQTPPPADYRTEDGLLDPIKFLDDFKAELKAINDEIANVEQAYDNSVNEIGHQYGTTAPLIQGEQAYQENKKQIKLNYLQRQKESAMEMANMEFQVMQYKNTLRQDQQKTMESWIQTMMTMGLDPDNMSPESQALIDKYATLSGVNASAVTDLLKVSYNMKTDADREITMTQEINGILQGFNKYGELMKTFGPVNNFQYQDNGDGTYSIFNPATGVVETNVSPYTGSGLMGDATITGLNGSSAWAQGLDMVLSGGNGTAITTPFSGTVIEVRKESETGGFGNQIKMRTDEGDEIWFSHLADFGDVKVGQYVGQGAIIGTQGNTGTVMDLNGNRYDDEAKAQGKGTHLDVTMKKPDGNYYTPQDVALKLGYASKGGEDSEASQIAQSIMNGTSNMTLSDVSTSDNLRARVSNALGGLKEEALNRGDMEGVMMASAGGTQPDSTFLTSFEKAWNTLEQVADLQDNIADVNTGPIIGVIRSNNPFDKKAVELKAQLASIVPNLARGVYGEVGVLTDNDIKTYTKTLPNLSSDEDVRTAIMGITLRSIQRSLENKIITQAGFGRDMSNPIAINAYNNIKQKADMVFANLNPNTFYVDAPDGQTYYFPDEESMNQFKVEANIQ